MSTETTGNLSPAAEIAGYIKTRILTGVYREGQRLPTAEEFAKQFSVDPNTARAAFARVAKAGLVRSIRGKGTFVTAEVEGGQARRVKSLVAQAIAEGEKLGLSAEDLATILWVQQRFSADEPRLWYIDTWYPFFDAVADQIEQATRANVQRLQLDALAAEVEAGTGPTAGDVVVTTKFSLPKVESALSGVRVRYVPVSPQLTKSTLRALRELPELKKLGVVCVAPIFADISGKVIARSGIDVDQLRGNSSDIASLLPVFDQADAITISTVALGRLRSAHIQLPDKPIIPFAYELGADCLEAVVNSFARREGAASRLDRKN